MPLHRLFVPPTLYSDQDRKDIAAAITAIYISLKLPPFYVVVLFIDVPVTHYFVSGRNNDKFLRIGIEHIARQFSNEAAKRGFMDRYEAVLAPWTKDRGIDWEVQLTEDDRNLWNENGMSPPLPGTDDEELWRIQNKAVPYGSYKF
ncbi:hypothetical protein FIBSPDRAFT_844546 [Athelia psychrophila]|uniref:Tautomerase cis-CaaD-like domain-containing protein n=1 Tax=Athelia psychrophila TaxID=1759441 RepID=A0A167UEH9_9AGAM|nr:hypothetical protein FIBSPDRAFT_844546 [Fibularhizoctonia sp. CBS 109695]